MSKKKNTPFPSEMTDRFLEEVTRRTDALGITPLSVMADAGVSVEMWENWKVGTFRPRATTMDRVLVVLDAKEKAK